MSDNTTLPDMRTREALRADLLQVERRMDAMLDAVRERIVKLETLTETQERQLTKLFDFHNVRPDDDAPTLTKAKAGFLTAATGLIGALTAWMMDLF